MSARDLGSDIATITYRCPDTWRVAPVGRRMHERSAISFWANFSALSGTPREYTHSTGQLSVFRLYYRLASLSGQRQTDLSVQPLYLAQPSGILARPDTPNVSPSSAFPV